MKNYIIPEGNYLSNFEWLAYAEEADILNVVLFGFTAKAWRDANPELAKYQLNVLNEAEKVRLSVKE